MCGIVGAAARRPVPEILLEGLRRLEYRGYDSAGLAVLGHGDPPALQRRRTLGKVAELVAHVHDSRCGQQPASPIPAGPRTARRARVNAHPHQSHDVVSVVHNGIIENYEPLRQRF
jgi:glutamine---fructose-6-phosphate transaminase (isomerizing)